MPMTASTKGRIESMLRANKILLFMKGTPQMPQCGFSAATIGILNSLTGDYATVNVLEDQEIREGIKAFSAWPTIPQLYIDEEFVGGCDIIREMFNTGELHTMLGLEEPDRTPPAVVLSPDAVKMIRETLNEQPGVGVHLQIDANWQHNLRLAPVEGHEITAHCDDVVLHMDISTAPRAQGLKIDLEETLTGYNIKVENPNLPADSPSSPAK